MNSKKIVAWISLLCMALLGACDPHYRDLQEGDLCTIKNSDNNFGVVKVVLLDNDIYHLRVYSNIYVDRPHDLDSATLTMEPDYTKAVYPIEELSIDRVGFYQLEPQFLSGSYKLGYPSH